MKNQIFIILLFIFIGIISLFHSHLFGFFGYENFIVDGNYEFTKVMIFNIFSPLLFIFYFLCNFRNIKKYIFQGKSLYLLILIYVLLGLSTSFSIIPNISFFGGGDKGHGFIFLNNLFILFLIIYHYFNITKSKKIFSGLLFIITLVSLVGIKEYYSPSYSYGDLGNRLISTLGHPNYVSAVLLFIIPYNFNLIKNQIGFKRYGLIIIIGILLFSLLLTKSLIAIYLVILYFIYNLLFQNKTNYFIIFSCILTVILSLLVLKFIPEKLNSFIARFYIWETTLKIIFSDIKIFFFGIGADNLKLLFDNFKSPELYLYENIGFNADRPHNIFLNIWIHYGVFLFLFSLLGFYKGVKNLLLHHNWYNTTLVLLVIFWCFNFPNILGYILFVILLAYSIYKNKADINLLKSLKNKQKNNILLYILIFLLGGVNIIGSYFSYNIYKSQTFIHQDKYSEAIQDFPYYGEYYYNNMDFEKGLIMNNNYFTEKYYLYKVYFSFSKIPECRDLVNQYPSVENYFYCGGIIENKFDLDTARIFYEKGVAKMPNIWDTNNSYLQEFPSKYIINPERILHPKYSNIGEILEKLNIK